MNKKEASYIISIALAAMPNLSQKNLEPTVNAWAAIMPDISYTEGKAAMIKLLRERSIPTLPLPGEIIAAVKELRDSQKDKLDYPPDYLAWQEVKKAITNDIGTYSSPAIKKAVDVIGRATILYATYDLSDKFMKIYNTIVNREKAQAANQICIDICTDNGLKINVENRKAIGEQC